jgi:hypothetical protein
VYVHAEKRIPAPDKDLHAPAAAENGGKAAAATHEHPITPLRRVAAQHIGKLVRVRVSAVILLLPFFLSTLILLM